MPLQYHIMPIKILNSHICTHYKKTALIFHLNYYFSHGHLYYFFVGSGHTPFHDWENEALLIHVIPE